MKRRNVLMGIGPLPLVACSRAAEQVAVSTKPWVVVHKNESCGCCTLWVTHLKQAGFQVEVRNEDNQGPVKERVGVPVAMGSCHTAEVEGYFAEGHVPAQDLQRLLRERPRAKGLTVPGMPAGSPGMEVPGHVEPYDVYLVALDGSTSVYSHHVGLDSGPDSRL